MISINQDLRKLEEEGKPIRVGLVGAGQMGTDIVSQISQMKGIVVAAICDIDLTKALKAYETAGIVMEIVTPTENLGEAADLLNEGKLVVTSDASLIPQIPQLEAIIDATGDPEVGAKIALGAIDNGKHIVMLNVEADVTVGPILNHLAKQAGVVYTLSAGDEPAAIMELYNFVDALGLEVVAAGKGKNNPLDCYATPKDWEEEARSRGLEPRMLVEFVDGSKTMIEMTAVSNATGLLPDVSGMHGPEVNVEDLKEVFSLKSQGGILNTKGIVDFAIGNVAPGVFVIATTEQERLKQCLVLRSMGKGPNYLFYRPYHLCSMETPLSVAFASLYRKSTMSPLDYPFAETVAVAKRDLRKGEVLDRIGEYKYFGRIVRRDQARELNALPIGLAKGAKLKTNIKKEMVITYDMIEFQRESLLLELRRLQDIILEPEK